jgi:hypothetical protein
MSEQDVISRIVATARAMLHREIHPIDGCRVIHSLRKQLSDSLDPVFHIFIGVSSETDSASRGSVRSMWSAAALRREDARFARYIEGMQSDLDCACFEIIQRFDSRSDQGNREDNHQ